MRMPSLGPGDCILMLARHRDEEFENLCDIYGALANYYRLNGFRMSH